ncbi:hypothetical protein GJV85_12765 [Sulfurimonas aquatica]|uniref:DUF2231 domain-containing protein n=1 Tax=Sulfurimonas aquatica TaxID=2672570 RepID=A0A975B2A9_9BACT|nr:DUF2231 domain-containing protein [Sulfurimonas aquatica]QSZ42941.1 hypothetical protein GJV85_12765 [Sulfurimonas aquatica]
MMLHPATVHFAMVLPVVASVFGIIYLIKKDKMSAQLSSLSTLVAAFAMIVAWYTGSEAGPQIYDYLSEAGQHELIEHKELGLYLAIALSIVAILKILGCKMQKFFIEAISIILLLLITATTFLQGKDGGEIVYEHGMPFKAYMIEDSLNEAQVNAEEEEDPEAKVEIYEETIEDIKLLSQEVNELYSDKSSAEESQEEEKEEE